MHSIRFILQIVFHSLFVQAVVMSPCCNSRWAPPVFWKALYGHALSSLQGIFKCQEKWVIHLLKSEPRIKQWFPDSDRASVDDGGQTKTGFCTLDEGTTLHLYFQYCVRTPAPYPRMWWWKCTRDHCKEIARKSRDIICISTLWFSRQIFFFIFSCCSRNRRLKQNNALSVESRLPFFIF